MRAHATAVRCVAAHDVERGGFRCCHRRRRLRGSRLAFTSGENAARSTGRRHAKTHQRLPAIHAGSPPECAGSSSSFNMGAFAATRPRSGSSREFRPRPSEVDSIQICFVESPEPLQAFADRVSSACVCVLRRGQLRFSWFLCSFDGEIRAREFGHLDAGMADGVPHAARRAPSPAFSRRSLRRRERACRRRAARTLPASRSLAPRKRASASAASSGLVDDLRRHDSECALHASGTSCSIGFRDHAESVDANATGVEATLADVELLVDQREYQIRTRPPSMVGPRLGDARDRRPPAPL